MRSIFIIASVILLVAAALGVAFIMDLHTYAQTPANPDAHEKIVSIPPGKGFHDIASRLQSAGIINDSRKFGRFAQIKGYDKKIRAGEYALSPAMTPEAILNTLVNGKVRLHRITIPEGYNLEQIALILQEAGLADQRKFITAASDPERVRKAGFEGPTFEGYLFPDTYYFPKAETIDTIIGTMVDRFRSVFIPDWRNRAKEMGFSVHDIVTLASIIEKETGAPSERELISSVFHNRLKKRMRLESDPTVIYGIKDFNGNLTRKDLRTYTEYNTYRIKGLPPGPIANPGKAALEAALYPADTEYLYFVSKKDTTHHFSTNFTDHNQAVRKYQLRRKR